MSEPEREEAAPGPAREPAGEDWERATRCCHELRVSRTIPETRDAISIVFEIPDTLEPIFRYRAGQHLRVKIPYGDRVLTRSYSLSSSPDTDGEHKVTVKRVDGGRISNWLNDHVRAGSRLMVTPPAGLFVLDPASSRDVVLLCGGSGVTPCISILKSALAASRRRVQLVYANRDARSILFRDELEALRGRHPDRLRVRHHLDAERGYLCEEDVRQEIGSHLDRDFFLCGPAPFMEIAASALRDLGVAREQIAIERFVSPPDRDESAAGSPARGAEEAAPETITIALDGEVHEIPYDAGERVLHAARRAGLDPPYSCEEGYCSCCMARLTAGEVAMANNDCLTPELLAEGWVLTCQSRCVGPVVRIEYPE